MHPLEKFSHIALTGVAILSLGLLVERRFHSRPTDASVPGRGVDENTLVGKRLELPGPAAAWSKRNVVLFLNSHCGYCIQTLFFFSET